MHSALTLVESPGDARGPDREHPLDQLLRTASAAPAPAENRLVSVLGLCPRPRRPLADDRRLGVVARPDGGLRSGHGERRGRRSVRLPGLRGPARGRWRGHGRRRKREERVEDPALLARFVSECEAKYGFEPDPQDPDTPVYTMRAGPVESRHAAEP